jgi:hypothetical protein
MEAQLDISCRDCHGPRLSLKRDGEGLGNRLVFLNKKVPDIRGRPVAVTRKGTPLYNVQMRDGKLVVFRKLDGHALELDARSLNKPHHTLKGHERLSCQACHSAWMPQCYGCHLTYRESQMQREWIHHKLLPGKWTEARSYVRFFKPALGFRDRRTIYPISPCQVFVSVFDKGDTYRPDQAFKVLTLSAFDPHTTSAGSRSCTECHGDPKVLGLGEGLLHQRNGTWVFRPTYDAAATGLGIPFPLDGYVDVSGKRLQTASRKATRPFNGKEIQRILAVTPCLGCHNRYDDPIYRDFPKALSRFNRDPALPCLNKGTRQVPGKGKDAGLHPRAGAGSHSPG